MIQRPFSNLLCFLPILLFAATTLRAQTDSFTIVYSSQITYGQYINDYDIVSARIGADGTVLSRTDSPIVISAQVYREFAPSIAPDCVGGYFMAYSVERAGADTIDDRDILVRHINAAGENTWGDSVSQFVTAASSKQSEEHARIFRLDDGTLLVLYEVRYTNSNSNDIDVAVVRLNSDGTVVPASSAWVVNGNRQERISSVVSNGRGGAYVVIEAQAIKDSIVIASDILVQQISWSGAIGWKDSRDPVALATSKHLERNAVATSDGRGGIFVAYELKYTSEVRNGDIDILAQHLDEFGRRSWTRSEAPPFVSSYPGAHELNPAIARDSTGIIVAFEVISTIEGKSVNAIGVQRLDSVGRATWNDGKTSTLVGMIGVTPTLPQLVADSMGGAFLVFEALDSSATQWNVWGEHIGVAGEPDWGEANIPEPIFASDEHESRSNVCSDGKGGILITAVRAPIDHIAGIYTAVVIARRNADGSNPWEAIMSPIIVAATPNNKERPIIVGRCAWQ